MGGRSARSAVALAAVALAIAAAALPARAQLLDVITVEPAGSEAEIRIRLSNPVQIVRYFPEREGKVLRITLQVLGRLEDFGGRTLQDTRTPETHGLLPRFTVTYPEPGATLGIRFDESVKFRVGPGTDSRTVIVYVPRIDGRTAAAPPPASSGPPAPVAPPAPAAPPPRVAPPAPAAPPAAPSPGAPVDMESLAAGLLREGRDALQRNDPAAAIDSLNRVLNLPPNRSSQDAQELIGLARERNGEYGKARVEYELYLKLYPKTEGAERVAKRLAVLPVAGKETDLRAVRRPETTQLSWSGSFSQYYYRGASRFDATLAPPVPGLQPSQVSLTSTDQSSLVSSADLVMRMRGPDADSKIVFRDVYTSNYLQGQYNDNRLYSLYYERLSADSSSLARIGRQPGYTGGMLGRFDGVWAGYGFHPGLRLNAVVGSPVEFYPAPDKRFAGVNADIGPIAERWTGNIFFVQQESEGVLDRRAVGGELRYFDPHTNIFGLYDYDTSFHAVNISMVQGSHTTDSGTVWTAIVDHRRVPALQTTNVLIGQSQTIPGVLQPTLRQLIDAGASLEQLQEGAKALTPIADTAFLGFTHPVTPKLQLGADAQGSRVSGTGASGDLPATPSAGIVRIYSVLGIKTGVLTAADVLVLNYGVIDASTFRGRSASVDHVYQNERWRTEVLLRYYTQTNDQDVLLRRKAPVLRLGYRIRNTLTLEAEIGAEITTNDGPTQTDKTTRRYFSLGYRWDIL